MLINKKSKSSVKIKLTLFKIVAIISLVTPQLFAQSSKPRVNNEKPEKGNQVKRMHPHALKLILQGNKQEAIDYLEATSDKAVNPGHTKMLLDLARGKPDTW